jgi:DNA-binding response OmpR family regulator
MTNKRILLVDDDLIVRDSLKDLLLGEGYAVIPAENGQQALDLASQVTADLVLLDLNMPIKGGWDTFEQLTRERPTLPIIIVTARPNQLFTAVSAGAGALMEKPMDIPALLQAIKKLLAERPEQRLARLVGEKSDFHYIPAPTIRQAVSVPKASLHRPDEAGVSKQPGICSSAGARPAKQ